MLGAISTNINWTLSPSQQDMLSIGTNPYVCLPYNYEWYSPLPIDVVEPIPSKLTLVSVK